MDWIYLTLDGDKWLPVVKTLTNIRISSNVENALTGRGTVRF